MISETPLQFYIKFYENLYQYRKTDKNLINLLSNLYAQAGDIESSTKMDQEQVNLEPENPVTHYNLACDFSLQGKTEDAIRELQSALELGYCDYQWIRDDIDLDSIRETDEFKSTLSKYFQHFNY
jgi:tetratricopeptide (TPR) repeat protein